ncbi:MAG: Na+/H+ antiporter NhaC family protein, partial [Caldibacillus sp.]
MIATIYSLIPPLLALALVLITKRVILSLGSGIVAAALLIAIDREAGLFQIITKTANILYDTVKHIFWEDGRLNTGNLYILLFLLFLGIITALITISGGS